MRGSPRVAVTAPSRLVSNREPSLGLKAVEARSFNRCDVLLQRLRLSQS